MSACPSCGFELVAGCSCGWESTADFEARIGSTTDETELVPRIDPVTGNLIVCGASGLSALLADRYVNPPHFRIRRTTDLTVTAQDEVNFDAEDYDSHGMHSVASAAVNPYAIVPIPGYWKIGFGVLWDTAGPGNNRAVVYVNRFSSNLHRLVEQKEAQSASGNYFNREAEALLSIGDVLSLELSATDPGADALADGAASIAMWGRWLGDGP